MRKVLAGKNADPAERSRATMASGGEGSTPKKRAGDRGYELAIYHGGVVVRRLHRFAGRGEKKPRANSWLTLALKVFLIVLI